MPYLLKYWCLMVLRHLTPGPVLPKHFCTTSSTICCRARSPVRAIQILSHELHAGIAQENALKPLPGVKCSWSPEVPYLEAVQ